MQFLKKNERGVVALEACIVLPIFVLLLMFFYGLIVMFTCDQLICHALIQSAESLSLDPYSTNRVSTSLENVESGGNLIQALYAGLFTSGNKYFSSDTKWYEENGDELLETVKNRFLGYMAGSGNDSEIAARADAALKTARVTGGLSGVDFSGTKVEDGKLTITIKYKQEFVFNFGGLAAFDRERSVCVTLWE